MTQNIVQLDFHDTERAMDLLFASGIPVIIKSNPGQGKTSLIKQYKEKQGADYGLFELNGSLANLPDFMGWFYKCEEHYVDYDGNDVTIQNGRYTFPYWHFDKQTGRPIFQFKKGVIVIEEYGQTELDLKKSFGQMTLERRIGQYQLPEGIDIVMLSNYEGGRDAVGRDFDFLINRRAELHMKQTIDSSLVFMHKRKFLNITMAFASLEQHKVFDGEAPKDQGPFLTPRSLEALDAFMRTVLERKLKLDDPMVRVSAAGIVGPGAAHQYIAFAGLRSEIPSIDEIVRNPLGTKVPVPLDQQMFLVFNMAEKAEKANIGALVTYLARLRSDMGVAFYRNALMRDKSLMSCREFGDWAVENKALLAIVNSRV
jgi:hypothetical protein